MLPDPVGRLLLCFLHCHLTITAALLDTLSPLHTLAQAYAVGTASHEQVEACQDVRSQLQSPDGAVVPFCLVSDKSSHGDYNQIAMCEINLQVCPCTLLS